MNGEDTDLTMQFGRLGYRSVIDPRIRCYEPRSAGEFVEQRTRWARAGFHVYARHVPMRSGSAGPRVWFWTMRRGFSWFSVCVRILATVGHAGGCYHTSRPPFTGGGARPIRAAGPRYLSNRAAFPPSVMVIPSRDNAFRR